MTRSRLFWKLFICFWLAMVLSFVSTLTYFTLTGTQRQSESVTSVKAGFMLSSAENLLARSGPAALSAVLPAWNAAGPPHLALLDAGGQVLDGTKLSAEASRRAVEGPDGTRYALVTDVRAIDSVEHEPSAIAPVMSGAVVAFVFSALVAWYLSRPIRHLRRALHAVAEGNLATRVGALMGRRRDEIADLGRDFDSMAAQLQLLVEGRQRLLHDVSHELRSPLTRMQAAIGLLRQNPAKTEAMIERIDREAGHLDAMVEELLTLARLEVGSGAITRERVDLIELLAAIVEDAAFEAESCGRAVHFSAHGQFVSMVSGELLCRAFENIIRNAVKFTAAGTAVDVRANPSGDGSRLDITVEDHGPGVEPEMLDRMFEPFVRGEAERPGTGFGLGLAIARRAIESHGGQVRAEPAEHGGLRVAIMLPACAA